MIELLMPESALNERVSDNLKKMSKARGQISRRVRSYIQARIREIERRCKTAHPFATLYVLIASGPFAIPEKIRIIERMLLTIDTTPHTNLKS